MRDGFLWDFNKIQLCIRKLGVKSRLDYIRQTIETRDVCSHGQTICNILQTEQFKNSALYLRERENTKRRWRRGWQNRSKLNSYWLQLDRFGNYFCSVEKQTLWQAILIAFLQFPPFCKRNIIIHSILPIHWLFSRHCCCSSIAFNIMSTWFHLVHLPCFGFHDLMWSILDCMCVCAASSLLLDASEPRPQDIRNRARHGGDSDRKLTFENVWRAPSRSFIFFLFLA